MDIIINILFGIIIFILFVWIITNMIGENNIKNFFKKKPQKTKAKKEYEELLFNMKKQALENGEYEFKSDFDYKDKLYITYKNLGVGQEEVCIFETDITYKVETHYEKYANLYVDIQYTKLSKIQKLELKEYVRIYEEKKKELELKKQLEEEKEYLEKIQKLLKLKPLDEEMQETFKRVDRIQQIHKMFLNGQKELILLRKQLGK